MQAKLLPWRICLQRQLQQLCCSSGGCQMQSIRECHRSCLEQCTRAVAQTAQTAGSLRLLCSASASGCFGLTFGTTRVSADKHHSQCVACQLALSVPEWYTTCSKMHDAHSMHQTQQVLGNPTFLLQHQSPMLHLLRQYLLHCILCTQCLAACYVLSSPVTIRLALQRVVCKYHYHTPYKASPHAICDNFAGTLTYPFGIAPCTRI